jgi:dTDP-glucose pyrophosphorylase/ribosomal protein S18 acetylase RimI-like enzyme
MKAVILAAWEWTRLRPLTDTVPKPLIKVFWKPIIEYTLESLFKYIDEFIIVVRYKQDIIKDALKTEYKGVKISYIEQWDEKWTWAAIKNIEIKWDFLILNWDSIFDKKDLLKLIDLIWYGCLVKKSENPEKYWVFKENDRKEAIEIIEKPEAYIWNLINLWVYKVNNKLIDYCKETKPSIRWEIEITCALNNFFQDFPFKLIQIEWDFMDISYPSDIEKIELDLKDKLLKKPYIWEATHLQKTWEFDLYLWIEKNLINDLLEYSSNIKDIDLLNNTWDLKRFSTRENFVKWYNDDWRYLFTLVSKNELAWIWWWRPSKLPNISEITNKEIAKKVEENEKDSHTSWIRIYPNFRWKWLAKIILQWSTYFYRKIFSNAFMCVDVDKENIASQKTYEKNGYEFFWYWENKKTVSSQEEPRLLYIEIPKK